MGTARRRLERAGAQEKGVGADSGGLDAVAGFAFLVEVAAVDDHAAAGYHMIRY